MEAASRINKKSRIHNLMFMAGLLSRRGSLRTPLVLRRDGGGYSSIKSRKRQQVEFPDEDVAEGMVSGTVTLHLPKLENVKSVVNSYLARLWCVFFPIFSVFFLLICFWLQSDVTTRVQLCFGHCKRCKKCVFPRACHVNCLLGLGWLEDCLAQCKRCQMCVFLHACHINCHVGLGWGGGWGVMMSLNLHAWLMLRHPWGWGGVGWDVITFVAHEHMLNATQLLRFLLGCSRSLHLHTCSMLCNCCVSCWDAHVPCTCTHGHSPADFLNLNNDSKWIYE